ncbi:hypothetical protein B0H13DRAFT_1895192 [Mycena leptocephala]|nr:hypothetical protein B0H13DRAFT_1895192 [Mycena leptocephala]
MAPSSGVLAPIAEPTFPEDIEQTITDVLLNDARDMCGTMSLVASRFHASRTKPFKFRTVVVCQRSNWLKRISDILLPNASFIHVLAINLPLSEGQLTDDELSLLRQLLLESTEQLRHLVVVWHLWTHFPAECGYLHLESFYLICIMTIWDRAWSSTNPLSPPTLGNLRHPAELKDLTFYAPPNLTNPVKYRPIGTLYLPPTNHCPNLEYLTYVADRTPVPAVSFFCGDPRIKGVMFVCTDGDEEEEVDSLIVEDKRFFPNFSAAYLPSSSQGLEEWLAKLEGRRSVFEHLPPRAVELVVSGDMRHLRDVEHFRSMIFY